MAVAAGSVPRTRQNVAQPWLRTPRWDLMYLIFSIALAFIPYSVFLLFGTAGSFEVKGTQAYDTRLLINNVVAILIGGPHMYATFTRTLMDPAFVRRRLPLLVTSFFIPIAVFACGVLSYQTYVWLLTVFFAIASLHALYQIIWLSDAYNLKAARVLSWKSRLIDYGVVLTSLYPIATYKMVEGTFTIGPVALKYHDLITTMLPALPGNSRMLSGQYWLSALAFLAFGLMLILWIGKTVTEYRRGYLNVPKTLLIGVTVPLMFLTPLIPNLDTAFQGVNTWHSFQYLVLTWFAISLHEQHTGRRISIIHWVDAKPRSDGRQEKAERFWPRLKEEVLAFLRRFDRGTGWTAFYILCLAMLPISGLLMWGSHLIWPELGNRGPGADEVYSYMGILSILLVHYAQDAILFTDSRSLVK